MTVTCIFGSRCSAPPCGSAPPSSHGPGFIERSTTEAWALFRAPTTPSQAGCATYFCATLSKRFMTPDSKKPHLQVLILNPLWKQESPRELFLHSGFRWCGKELREVSTFLQRSSGESKLLLDWVILSFPVALTDFVSLRFQAERRINQWAYSGGPSFNTYT